MNKPKRLIYLLSFLPGLGHFYLGAMNRGLQLMGIFFALFYFTTLGFENLFVFMPIVVFYAYFDALENYRHWLQYDEVKDHNVLETALFKEKKAFIGWGFVILGGYFFLDNFVMRVIYRVFGPYLHLPHNFLEKLLISFLFIFIGYRLLRGKKEEVESE